MLSHLGRHILSRRQFLSSLGVVATLPPAAAVAATSPDWKNPIPKNFPQPKFHLGQQVLTWWEDIDGQEYSEDGVIVGIILESECSRKEWSYLVCWTETGDSAFVYENELNVHLEAV